MPQAAAVIDLDAFRRRRGERSGEPEGRRSVPAGAASACLVPVWVTWVPMWLVR